MACLNVKRYRTTGLRLDIGLEAINIVRQQSAHILLHAKICEEDLFVR